MFVILMSHLLACTLIDKEESVDSSVPPIQDSSMDSGTELDIPWVTPDCPDSMQNIFNEHSEESPSSGSEEY